jgi:hypothetical protein
MSAEVDDPRYSADGRMVDRGKAPAQEAPEPTPAPRYDRHGNLIAPGPNFGWASAQTRPESAEDRAARLTSPIADSEGAVADLLAQVQAQKESLGLADGPRVTSSEEAEALISKAISAKAQAARAMAEQHARPGSLERQSEAEFNRLMMSDELTDETDDDLGDFAGITREGETAEYVTSDELADLPELEIRSDDDRGIDGYYPAVSETDIWVGTDAQGRNVYRDAGGQLFTTED